MTPLELEAIPASTGRIRVSRRVGRDIRLILAVDDDPIFGQILVTLFRVVRHNEVDRSYRSIAHLLYRNRIERNGRAL